MTKKELLHVQKVLARITNPSGHVELALAYIRKDLAVRESQKDNFKGDYDSPPW